MLSSIRSPRRFYEAARSSPTMGRKLRLLVVQMAAMGRVLPTARQAEGGQDETFDRAS
jgi:hypothetical protein